MRFSLPAKLSSLDADQQAANQKLSAKTDLLSDEDGRQNTRSLFSLLGFCLVVSHSELAQDPRLAARREDRMFQSAAAGTVRAETEDVM